MNRQTVVLTALLVFVVALAGCSRSKPETAVEQAAATIRVTDIQVGRSAGPDNTLAEVTNRFAPSDTFYVAVRTEGVTPNSTLKARWTYEDGQVVDEYMLTIATTDAASTLLRTEMHDGWPVGEYMVEIFLDGVSAGQMRFVVGE